MRIYDLPAAWACVEADLEETGGELTPEMETRLRVLLEGGADALDNAMKVVRTLEAQAKAAKDEADRLSDRAASFTNHAKRLRGYILPALEAMGGRCKTALFSFSVQHRTSVAVALKPGFNVWDLPPRFYRVAEPELATAEIKKAEASGENLPEALAIVKTPSTSLMVR